MRLTYGQLDDFLVHDTFFPIGLFHHPPITYCMHQLQVALEINMKLQPRYRPHCHVVYFPQLGYLITLPRVFDTEIDEATREHLGFTLQVRTLNCTYDII